MWDGTATWCVSVGPHGCVDREGSLASTCRLFFYSPNSLMAGQKFVEFNVLASDSTEVEFVLRQLGRARHALEAMVALGKFQDLNIVSNRYVGELG